MLMSLTVLVAHLGFALGILGAAGSIGTQGTMPPMPLQLNIPGDPALGDRA